MVMKRFIVLLLPLILLVGCRQKNNEEQSSKKDPFYNVVEDLHIEWKDMFLDKEEPFYVYVYSITCPPCSSLREQVVNFAQADYVPFYFVYPSDDIVFVDDVETAENSIGATRIEDVSIYNTPTLIGISNKKVTSYTRDYYAIKNFIESYTE